jgi:hypothetical protein
VGKTVPPTKPKLDRKWPVGDEMEIFNSYQPAGHTLRLGRMALVCGLWLFGASGSGSTGVPPAAAVAASESRNVRGSEGKTSCKKDSNCPSGQRCGFTGAMGCAGRGTCVVEKAGASCADPGGRCGCDGQPVDLFCAVGSSTEFASAPVGSVGACPIPCTEDAGCPHHLVCRKGICATPQNGRSD